MAAALTREPRLRQLLPVAVVERWSVRRLAREAKISFGAAGAALRLIRQRSATNSHTEEAEMLGETAARIRITVAKAVYSLLDGLEVEIGRTRRKMTPARLIGLSVSMEAYLRMADNLDGLAHKRAAELALLKRVEGDNTWVNLQGSDQVSRA